MNRFKQTTARVVSLAMSLSIALLAVPPDIQAFAEETGSGQFGNAQSDAAFSAADTNSSVTVGISADALSDSRDGITLYADAVTSAAESEVQFSGKGTAEEPFKIGSAEDLKKLSSLVNAKQVYTDSSSGDSPLSYASAHYILERDIDLSSETDNWQPIGRSSDGVSVSSVYFGGVFDGNGHTISGLHIDGNNISGTQSGRLYRQGLFGHNEGVIKNLSVANAQLNNLGLYNGIIAASNKGTIENCCSGGSINGSYVSGGIVGDMQAGTIKNCYSTAVSKSTSYNAIGFITGSASADNCYYISGQVQANTAGIKAVSNEDLISGKLAWLLQNGQESGTLVWEQEIDKDSYPVLHYDEDSTANKVYKIAFMLGDTEIADDYLNTKGKTTAPDIDDSLDIDGYTIGDEWFKDESLSANQKWVFESDAVVDKDIKLYTAKKPVEYTIKYVLDGGNDPGNPATYNITSGNIVLKSPTKEDFEFVGWSGTDIDSGDPQLNVTIHTGSTGNRQYTANYRDTKAPTGKISIGDTTWSQLSSDVTFTTFYNLSQTVTIEGTDNTDNSDVEIKYYLSKAQLSKEALDSLTDWREYNGSFSITPEQNVIIYAKVTDRSGNSSYVNSDGIVLDITRPQISGVASGKDYCLSASFTVSEANLESVTIDGKTAEPNDFGKYIIDTIGKHTIVAKDKAGNTETIENINIINHAQGNVIYTTTKYATCVNEGSRTAVLYCRNCHAAISTTVETIAAKGHSFGEWENIQSPNCSSSGSRRHTCTVCQYTEMETLSEEGHLWNDFYTVDKQPTCTEPGSRSIHCSRCDAVKSSETIDVTAHTPGAPFKDKVIPADCTERGSYDNVIVCTVCKTELSRTTVTELAKGHSYSNWVTIKTPDCDDSGTLQRYCKICGIIETENISAKGHTWDKSYTIDQPATCTTVGSRSVHCSKCSATKDSETIPSLGHDPLSAVKENVLNASCTAAGGYDSVVYCRRCNAEVSRTSNTLSALGHSFGGWITVESPDCDDDGVQIRTCKTCGYSESKNIDETGHSWESSYRVDKAAGCVTEGSSSIHCKNCSAVKDSKVIPATGHNYSTSSVTKAATCTEPGTRTYKCSVCGAAKTETIPATGHSYTDKVVPPTSTSNGYTEHTCKVCGSSYRDSYTDSSTHKHSYTKKITKAATCTANGVITYTCSCGESYTETIKATGHSYTAKVVAATSTARGYTLHTCKVCGSSYKDSYTDYTPAHKHSYTKKITKAATCTANGVMTYTCSCGESYTETIKATGHSYTVKVVTPTYTSQGYTLRTCKVCKYSYKSNYRAMLTRTDISKASVSISGKKYAYTGKALKPAMTVKIGRKTLKSGTDYTVSYKNNKNTGKATVTITGKGKYKGKKSVRFIIKPKAEKLGSVTSPKSKRIKVRWRKDTQATGYQVTIALNKKFTKGKKSYIIKNTSTVFKTITKLKKGKTYYVKVRAYKTINATRFYGAYSNIKSVKCK